MTTTKQNNDARSRGDWQGFNWCRKDLRLAIYLRDGMACMWCGATLEDGAQLSLDHVNPHSNGGGNGADNLICACSKCNKSRGKRSAQAFAKATANYVNHGVTATQILAAIKTHIAQPIKKYRDEAKSILGRRPSWQSALEEASNK
jgi:hypothetical protein